MENIRVKTLDTKQGGSTWLLVLVVVFLLAVSLMLWGALVMLVTEYLAQMGVIEASLGYIESVGFGVLIAAATSVLGSLWNGK